jgi:hypothetical protein
LSEQQQTVPEWNECVPTDSLDTRPVLKPGSWTIFGKNPATPEMETAVDKAHDERWKLEGTWTSERVSPTDGNSETLEMLNKALEVAMSKPEVVKSIEDRQEGAKNAYEYFFGPQQYWRFKYKGNVYSLSSAMNTPIDLELVLQKIAAGEMPSEPVS